MNFLLPKRQQDLIPRHAASEPLFLMVEAACQSAIKRVLHLSDVSPRRLLTTKEAATYLTLSEREMYNLIANKQLIGVRHGKRLMIDIRDLEAWIVSHKRDDT